jgi:dihydropteroate synthase
MLVEFAIGVMGIMNATTEEFYNDGAAKNIE